MFAAVTLGQHACIYVAVATEWHWTNRHASCIGNVAALLDKVLIGMSDGGIGQVAFCLIFNGPGGMSD